MTPIAEAQAPVEDALEATPLTTATDDSEPSSESVVNPDLTAEKAALHQRIQAFTDRLAAAAPGTAEVDEIDNELVKMLEDQQTALAGALDSLNAAEGDAETEARWQAVELHGERLKRLVRLRSTARDRFSEDHRQALLSFDRTGLQQAERERRTMSLMVR